MDPVIARFLTGLYDSFLLGILIIIKIVKKSIGVFIKRCISYIETNTKTMFFLIKKYLNGKTSRSEEKKILAWIKESEANKKQYIDQITSWNNFQVNKNLTKSKDAFKLINKKLNITEIKKEKTYNIRNFSKYSALFLLAISTLYFLSNLSTSDIPIKNKMVSVPVTESIDDQIVLINEDGSSDIISAEKQQLSFSKENEDVEKLSFNTLKIPRGKVFKIILSDGTMVWLNAESKIRFPEKFLNSEDTRTVYLEGEAFFDVTHNKDKPFIVKSGELEIKVLGTKFNISSYPSEEHIKTTLVDGSVEIGIPAKNSLPLKLKPNYQAAYERSSFSSSVLKVNTDDFTAWIDKRIVFKNETFKSITTKIERIYNVNITNELENFDQERFTGEFDIETIEDILKTLKEISNFDYKINGRNIRIY